VNGCQNGIIHQCYKYITKYNVKRIEVTDGAISAVFITLHDFPKKKEKKRKKKVTKIKDDKNTTNGNMLITVQHFTF